MHSETPDILPFPTALKGSLLSDSELDTMKDYTLLLLEEVGVHMPSQRALDLFSDHGANVDLDEKIVRMPPDLVKRAMSTAPRSFILAGREERFDLLLDGHNSYLSTDGCGVHVFDRQSGQQRASKKADVEMMARVCDALPLISFFWPLVSAQDFGLTAPLHECHAGLTNTLKHVRGGTTIEASLAPYIVEMARTVAGSVEACRLRPPICANICTIAPLSHDANGLECALTYAQAGIPVSFMAMPTMGSTAPATPLGALVLGNAEVISAMVLVQLAYPGAPVFHSIETSLMDPITGGYISDVALPISMMAVEMAHSWNLPSLGGGSVSSDAAEIGWKSGSDCGFGAVQIPVIAGEICGYMGMMGSSMILYPEKVILDHEICLNAFDVFQGFEFNTDDIAFDEIREVGPRGHFLKQKHTRKHLRDFRFSPFLLKRDDGGRLRDPRDVAFEEFQRINESHKPAALPDQVLAELDRIIAAAENEAARFGD